MISFWIAAALLAAGAGALMLHRAARGGDIARAADPSVGVYRRALAEIDDLSDRDLLPLDERAAVRAEAARRLLAASDVDRAPVSASASPLIPLAAAAATAVLALAIYLAVGSPGAADQPFAARLADWRVHPERYPPAALAAALGAIAAERPQDVEPLRQLAALDVSLGDGGGAAHALRRAMAVAPARADLPAILGEVLVIQAHGAVSAEARALFERALVSDPAQPAPRYYLARARIAAGDTAAGLAGWRALLNTLPTADPRRGMLAAEIAQVEQSGHLPPVSGDATPPAGDVSQAIQGMVDGLAARLRASPDDPAGWVRLVRAYAVLGQVGKRDAALAQARARFAGSPAVLGQLADAARAQPMTSAGR